MAERFLNRNRALAEQVILMARRVCELGLTHGTSGNISARLPGENALVITPSGKSYSALTPAELSFVDFNGKVIGGSSNPSSELPVHLAAYIARDDCNAVIHTHSTYATILAVTRSPLPAFIDELTPIVGGEVMIADYGYPGSRTLAENFVAALGDRQAAILANHGAVAVGSDLNEALLVSDVLERVAQVYVEACRFGKVIPIPAESYLQQRLSFLARKGWQPEADLKVS